MFIKNMILQSTKPHKIWDHRSPGTLQIVDAGMDIEINMNLLWLCDMQVKVYIIRWKTDPTSEFSVQNSLVKSKYRCTVP